MADYGGFTNTTYPTTFGIFNTGGSFNGGAWNDAKTNQLVNASVTGGNPDAVKSEASYLTAQQPSLFQPNPDFIIVWKNSVSGDPAAIKALTQYQLNTEQMYLTG
jgi:peptide/nickel transport system substrate-binding protein